VNKHGHSKTLVAAQPGNRNAVKHGVYSPRTLAPRIDELEQAIGALPAETAALHILRRELAGLLTLSEAVDQALADDGIRGRGGEPRTLVSRRLRVNEMIRRTTQQYIETAHRSARPTAEDADEEVVRADAAQVSLPATVAARHGVHEIEEISPKELDPEFFLEAVIATEDASVTLGERVRARRLLNRRRATQPPLCTCIATLPARDEAQLQEWINRFAETAHQSSVDTPIAVFVRRYRAPDRTSGHGRRLAGARPRSPT
jgi:hypothetical protein